MSGFAYSHSLAANGRMDIGTPLVGKSTTINAGDVLILTGHTTYSIGGVPVARPLFAADVTAGMTAAKGIYGVALFDVKTDSAGKVTSLSGPSTIDGNARVQFALPSIAHALPKDPDSGLQKIYVAVFSPWNVFSALTLANEVADYYMAQRFAQIEASADSDPVHTIDHDPAETATSPVVVVGVDVLHPQFNSASGGGRVFVVGRNTFYSGSTGTHWAT